MMKLSPDPSADGLVKHYHVRAVLVPLLVTAFVFPTLYQPLLDRIWTGLRGLSLYNWSTFETIWTVGNYAWIEPYLTRVFLRHPEWRFVRPDDKNFRQKPRGMRRVGRRKLEIFTYIAPLLAMDLVMIKKFADVPLAAILESGNYQNFDIQQQQMLSEPFTNGTDTGVPAFFPAPPKTFLIPTLHNFTVSSPLQLHRALPLEAPSSRRLVTELILSFFIYDMLFFLFHLALHIIPPVRSLHAPHHSHPVQLHPQVTNHLSIPERLGLVLLANFSLNIIGSHVLTRTIFVPIFVWLLVEIHCGMDLPWAYDKVLPMGWGGGARKHMKHHNTGSGGLEPFFGWWDSLLEWAEARTSVTTDVTKVK
jgi:cholesterol 25-hydroxylase